MGALQRKKADFKHYRTQAVQHAGVPAPRGHDLKDMMLIKSSWAGVRPPGLHHCEYLASAPFCAWSLEVPRWWPLARFEVSLCFGAEGRAMPQVEGQEGVGQSCWNWQEGRLPADGALLSGRMCRASGGLALGDGSARCCSPPTQREEPERSMVQGTGCLSCVIGTACH